MIIYVKTKQETNWNRLSNRTFLMKRHLRPNLCQNAYFRFSDSWQNFISSECESSCSRSCTVKADISLNIRFPRRVVRSINSRWCSLLLKSDWQSGKSGARGVSRLSISELSQLRPSELETDFCSRLYTDKPLCPEPGSRLSSWLGLLRHWSRWTKFRKQDHKQRQ